MKPAYHREAFKRQIKKADNISLGILEPPNLKKTK
jgi:hypothetical protein